MNPAAIKRCSRCEAVEWAWEFRVRRQRSRDGLHGWCNPCYREYYNGKSREWNENNRERRRELDRQRYWADPEHGRARKRAWDAENRELVNARAARSYHENDGCDKARERRQRNPEPYRAALRRSYRKHRAKRLDWAHRRRLIVDSGAVPPEVIEEILSQPCAYCGTTERIEIDHVVPLSRGGTHTSDNLAPACRSCNASKGAR